MDTAAIHILGKILGLLVIVGKRRSISDLDPHPFGSVSLRVALEIPGDVLVIP